MKTEQGVLHVITSFIESPLYMKKANKNNISLAGTECITQPSQL